MDEEHRVHRVQLVSLDLQEESAPQVQLARWESQDPLDLLVKKVLMVSEETTGLQGDKESVDPQDHLVVQETKETLGKTGPRVLMALQAPLEPQDRGALWVFLAREASVGCRVFQDQRVHQENKEPQDQLEIKVLQAQLVLLVLMDLVVILALMVLQDLMVHQAKMVFLDKGETGEILAQKV